jgi:signal transduction histidine kinase
MASPFAPTKPEQQPTAAGPAIHDAGPAAYPAAAWSRAESPPGPAGNPISVLLIEDEPSIVQLLKTLMQPHHAQVLCARSGAQALELLARERPALITLDLVLPDLDGFSVLQQIRSRRELDEVPVLMISAQAEPAAQRRAYQGGVSDFIAKPFHVDLLDAKLRTWLRLAQRTSRLATLRDFAHEVRNPLTAIGAAAYRLTEADLGHEQRQRLGRAIAGEAERLGRMVRSYLDGAGADSGLLIGATPLTPDPLAVVHDLLDLNLAETTRPRVHLRGADIPALRADPDHLRQMVLNLVENALAATAQRGEVELALAATADAVRITVSDTGCGIASEDLPHIFEDGFTTRSDKQRGLGLGITQRLCNRAGGTLGVNSRVGEGTVFTLELPRA